MTWNSYHRRGEVLRTVIKAADERRDGILPMDVDGVAQTFEDDLDVVAALELRWHTQLAGQIERNLMTQPMDLETNVLLAWQQTAAELPGVRAILDHYAAAPATPDMARSLEVAAVKESQLLAMMAGKASEINDDITVRVGTELAEKARTTRIQAPAQECKVLSFMERIKAAMVA
jgi:hypothetical protein